MVQSSSDQGPLEVAPSVGRAQGFPEHTLGEWHCNTAKGSAELPGHSLRHHVMGEVEVRIKVDHAWTSLHSSEGPVSSLVLSGDFASGQVFKCVPAGLLLIPSSGPGSWPSLGPLMYSWVQPVGDTQQESEESRAAVPTGPQVLSGGLPPATLSGSCTCMSWGGYGLPGHPKARPTHWSLLTLHTPFRKCSRSPCLRAQPRTVLISTLKFPPSPGMGSCGASDPTFSFPAFLSTKLRLGRFQAVSWTSRFSGLIRRASPNPGWGGGGGQQLTELSVAVSLERLAPTLFCAPLGWRWLAHWLGSPPGPTGH